MQKFPFFSYTFLEDWKEKRGKIRIKMWVFYLISLPLTMGMVGITLWYFAGPDVARYVRFTVGYTWFCSVSIIILVPADIWTVRCLIMLLWFSFIWYFVVFVGSVFCSLVFLWCICLWCSGLWFAPNTPADLHFQLFCNRNSIVDWYVLWLLKIITFEEKIISLWATLVLCTSLMDYRAVCLKTIRFRFRILILLNKAEWLPLD